METAHFIERGNKMGSLLRWCEACRIYTMKDVCVKCSSKTRIPIPARFSINDHYGKYRRELKRCGAL
ncbi:MAG: RNA-protein complex protein Nop10 [Thermoplasmata archaeon]